MRLSRTISIPTLIGSFIVGLIFSYFLGIDKKKIYVYPSPENNHKILYRDNAKNCFQFYQQEVPCPSDKSKISSFPIQSIPSS